jgi:hypothetical protein
MKKRAAEWRELPWHGRVKITVSREGAVEFGMRGAIR